MVMRRQVVVVCVALVTLLTGSSRALAWDAPVAVDTAGSADDQLAIAGSPGQRTVLAWSRYDDGYRSTLSVRTRGADGAWTPAQVLSLPDQDWQNNDPSVAVDARGDALVVWDAGMGSNPGHDRVRAAWAPAGQPFGPPVVIGDNFENSSAPLMPKAALTPGGEAVVTWIISDYSVHWATRSPGGTWSADHTLTTPDQAAERDVKLALADDGSAVLAWGGSTATWASVRPAGGTFGAPVALGGTAAAHVAASIAARPDGTFAAVWPESDGSGGATMKLALRRPGAAAFDPPSTVLGWGTTLAPAFDPAGALLIVGLGGPVEPFSSAGAWTMTRGADGTWGAPQVIAPAATAAPEELPVLTFAPDGTTRAVWRHYDDRDAEHTRLRIMAATRPPGGLFDGATADVATVTAVATPPVAAPLPDGGAVAAWTSGGFGMGPVTLAEAEPAAPAGAPGTGGGASTPVTTPAAPAARTGSAAPTSATSTAPRRAAAIKRCHIPHLRGRTAAGARKLLRAHGCAGVIRLRLAHGHRSASRRRVATQHPAAGATTTVATRLELTLR
jgi:hypothetical protein